MMAHCRGAGKLYGTTSRVLVDCTMYYWVMVMVGERGKRDGTTNRKGLDGTMY